MLEMLLAQCVWSFLGNRMLHVACHSQDILLAKYISSKLDSQK